jgi:hypothetical protein
MAAARIPSAVELMRFPAGDRALRLQWLVRWHRDQAAAHQATGSSKGVTHHRNSLRKVMTVAAQCEVQIS